jgi:hypothetical protein
MKKVIVQPQEILQKKTYLSDTLVGLVPKNINEKAEKAKRIICK